MSQLDDADAVEQHLRALCREHSFDPPRRAFDTSPVPPGLKHLVPLAQVWGQHSGLARDEIIDATPRAVRDFVAEMLYRPGVQEQLNIWLAGPEAASGIKTGEFSEAYLAFTYLNVAADYFG
ncbi:MAG: hypothetical protein AB7O98_08025 [Hyphomonadaceae bacterium]